MTQEAARRDPAYLEHMLEAIARVRRYVGRKRRAAFLGDPLLQDAVMRNIEVIGEAAGRVSAQFAAAHPTVPWRKITGMRHRLIHGYVHVNLDMVWDVVAGDLATLEKQLRALAGRGKRSATKPPARRRR